MICRCCNDKTIDVRAKENIDAAPQHRNAADGLELLGQIPTRALPAPGGNNQNGDAGHLELPDKAETMGMKRGGVSVKRRLVRGDCVLD
jgi:hypothetical protein